MTNLPQKHEIKRAVSEYCEANGLSRGQFAVQVGVSSATISKIDNEDFESISDRLFKKIWNKVRKDKLPELYDTSDYRACARMCDKARKDQLMVGLLADTGMGKTTALKAYSIKTNVFYISYEKSMNTKQFLAALLKEMGISFEGSVYHMINRVADELNTLSNPLLIIDESGKMISKVILLLHELRDKTADNCGIVLAGMPYFRTNLDKLSSKEREGYAEFNRRINLWHTLKGLSPHEIVFICNASGVEDPDFIKDMRKNRRFGDLKNEILLHNLDANE